MSDVAYAEPEIAQLPHVEAQPAPVPQPSISEILDQHLNDAQQKKIAVENLSSIKFLIAPDGKSAISAEPLPSDKHRQIVEESLKTVLGPRAEDVPYLPTTDGLADKLGLSSGSHFVQIDGKGTIEMLAKAGVRDFAAALEEKKELGHAARVR